jgi:hypothetical protein
LPGFQRSVILCNGLPQYSILIPSSDINKDKRYGISRRLSKKKRA